MAITFGNTVQEFYLEKVRHTQAVRKARLAALKTREDAENWSRKPVPKCVPVSSSRQKNVL